MFTRRMRSKSDASYSRPGVACCIPAHATMPFGSAPYSSPAFAMSLIAGAISVPLVKSHVRYETVTLHGFAIFGRRAYSIIKIPK